MNASISKFIRCTFEKLDYCRSPPGWPEAEAESACRSTDQITPGCPPAAEAELLSFSQPSLSSFVVY